ncbi:MAG: nuclear transport factor 2 family protein [Solirubrobacteraceae bacterium]
MEEDDPMHAQREVEATLYRFARGFDEDDFGVLADCMTVDAELSSFEGTTSGRDAVLEMLRGRRSAAGADGMQPRHVLCNVEIELESDAAARARAGYVLFSTGPTGIETVSTGTYVDELVRESALWRVQRRRVNVDGR